ncbi:cytochrome P450 [Aspergillus pseudonomiae]|uniref:Cytochrome P450 n=1 Tax=Aspergillus pseudonomiae TaxID=1506151 RepID=A0A5N7DC48_9EURO|nr:cytochrome P450 [Aspergillus pseudonomiae]KAE8403348.1 cytochrome P450 [Aspergillus pseudonomiae]
MADSEKTGEYADDREVAGKAIIFLVFLVTGRVTYALVLYFKYFTPFKYLLTPPRRWLLTGNQTSLFREFPWDVARRWSETIPNNGLIRYYVALSNERLLVTSPKGLSEVLVHGAYDYTKTNLARFAIQRFTGNGLGFLDGEEHRMQKKGLLPAFATGHIKRLIPKFWAKAALMVSLIERSLEDDSSKDQRQKSDSPVVPLHHWGTRATLDIIGVVGMGYDFDTLTHPHNELSEQYRKMFLEPSNAFNWLELLGNYIDFRILLTLPVRKNRELTQGSQYIRQVAERVIHHKIQKQQRQSEESPPDDDIVAIALASGTFTEQQLVDHVMTFLVAGHESTATAFEWAMYELGRRPAMQSRLREEIRTHISSMQVEGRGTTTAAGTHLATTIESLPYLNAVCSEVLRFYPFVPFATRVASRDNTIQGTFVPKGTVVAFAAHATNHDAALWGLDADRFDPERWMRPQQGKSGGATSNFASLTFSAGPKSCIGQGWTRAELACLVGATVGRFEIALLDPMDNHLKRGKTMKLRNGVRARVKVVDGW